jgi:hypothetical protein
MVARVRYRTPYSTMVGYLRESLIQRTISRCQTLIKIEAFDLPIDDSCRILGLFYHLQQQAYITEVLWKERTYKAYEPIIHTFYAYKVGVWINGIVR